MSERATKTFLQSLTANPDSAASSLAKLLTLGMGLGQHDCGKAASAAARSSECRGTMTTTMRAQCFKTRQSTNGAVSPGIGAAARSCSHSSSILLTTEWAERRGVNCDRKGSDPTVSVYMRGTSRHSGPLLNGCTTPRYIAPTSRRYSLSWGILDDPPHECAGYPTQ